MHLYVSATNIEQNPTIRQMIRKLRGFGYTVLASGEVDDWQQAIEDSAVFLLVWQGMANASTEEWQLALQVVPRILILPLEGLDDLPDELKALELFQWSRYGDQEMLADLAPGEQIGELLHQKLRNDYAAAPPPDLPMEEPEPAERPDWLDIDDDIELDELADEEEKSKEETPSQAAPRPSTTPGKPAESAPPIQAQEQDIDRQRQEPTRSIEEGGFARRRQPITDGILSLKPPQFTTFYPEAVEPGKPYALMVFAHLDTMLDAVRKIAEGFAPMMGGKQSSGTTDSRAEVKTGETLTFVPRFPDLHITPAQQKVQWNPPHQQATFLFTVPPNTTNTIMGVVQVYKDPLLIGEIPVMMQVTSSAPAIRLNKEGEFQKFDPIFASYSHADSPVMEFFRQNHHSLGQKMLVDIYDLRIGDHWEKRLLQMIDECAVFQLFWSKNSAESPYCRQEWEYALQYDGKRPRFIQPVYWEGDSPAPDPVPELTHIQFQKVYVPPLTRVEAFFARTRRLLKKWM